MDLLVTDEIYHVFTRSIAGYKVFLNERDYVRFKLLLGFYKVCEPPMRFSYYRRLKSTEVSAGKGILPDDSKCVVEILAYCIMPTHIHLVLKQLTDRGISNYMNNVLNSYSKYFNTRMKRKGPLWEGRFNRVHVEADEQLMHLSRYVHLNPVTASLVNNPDDWEYSSFKEYMDPHVTDAICKYSDVLEIQPQEYKSFVLDNIDYQRELARIKHEIIE